MDKNEKKEFEEIKWKSILSSKVDEFSHLITDDKVFNKYFGIEYVEKISQKSKDLSSINIKLGILYGLMMISLFATQYGKTLDFQVLGYAFRSLAEIKEYILLVAAILSLVTSVFSVYETYLQKIINECLKKLTPDENVRGFYKHLFLHEPLDVFSAKPIGEKRYWHGATDVLIGFILLAISLSLVSILVAFFFVQLSVIYDIFANSGLSDNRLSIVIVSIASLSIFVSILIYMLNIPMPVVDYGVYDKLEKLEKEDPGKYEQVMAHKIKIKNVRETRLIVAIACLIFVFTFSIYSIFILPQLFDEIARVIFVSIFGSAVVMFFSLEANSYLQKYLYENYFKNKPSDSDEGFNEFKNLQRKIWFYRVFFPLTFSVLYLTTV